VETNQPTSPLQQGLALLKAGNAAGAVAPLATALKADPNSFPACLALGLALSQCQRLDQAAAALGRAAKLQPGHALCWYHLGVVQQQRGDAAAARTALEAALRCDPGLERARQALSQLAPAAAPAPAPVPPAAAPAPAAAAQPTAPLELGARPPASAPAAPSGMSALEEEEGTSPLGGPAPGTAPPGRRAPRSAVSPAPAAPSAASGPPKAAEGKEIGRLENVDSSGAAGIMEYWDLVCTPERVYFVRMARGIPAALVLAAGVGLGLVVLQCLRLHPGRITEIYRNYAVAGGGGALLFLLLQMLLLQVAASAARVSLGKLPPTKACEDTGGFSLDWGELRSHRLVKGKLTVYNTQIKKTFGLGKRMAELDKMLRAQIKASATLGPR